MRAPLIIGGGPAGAAAACLLARSGQAVTLLERQRGPADKVCGDFLSVEAIDVLTALGIDLPALHPAPIRCLRLIHAKRAVEVPLPFAALGLSRRVLDEAVLRHAIALGATVHRGCAVRGLRKGQAGWIAHCDELGDVAGDTAFLATGKHDLRGFARPARHAQFIGLKMYYDLAPDQQAALSGAVELALFPGGYAGLQCVEQGRAVLCLLVGADRFRHAGGQWASLLAELRGLTPHLAQRLRGARQRLPRPLAVAAIPYGHLQQPPVCEGLFRLGDQACVIPSLTGDGVAIALHSAALAVAAWRDGQGADGYHRTLAQRLRPPMRAASLLHLLCLTPRLQSLVGIAVGMRPQLAVRAATATRVPRDRLI